MKSDGSIDVMEVKGTLAVICNDESAGKVQVQLSHDSVGAAGDNGFQFKTNPNMSKNDFLKTSLLCLKNKNATIHWGNRRPCCAGVSRQTTIHLSLSPSTVGQKLTMAERPT